MKLYEGAYHDLLNDLDQEVVVGDIEGWISKRPPAAPPPACAVRSMTDHFSAGVRIMVAQAPLGRVATLYPLAGDLFSWACVAGVIAATLLRLLPRFVQGFDERNPLLARYEKRSDG